MKDDNKKFLDTAIFRARVLKVMKLKNITMDKLYETINDDKIGYYISKNNLGIYLQRVPNINFIIALSKALGVPSDYLLGISDEDSFNSSFDYDYEDKKYKKYLCQRYFFYFYPTASSTPKKVVVAELSIEFDVYYKATLIIKTDEGNTKKYIGEFILSKDYDVGYITLKGTNIGEIVHLSFHDPIINGDSVKTELLVGTMSSVSCGDLNRMPVMSRFILSRNEIPENNLLAIKANLNMNNKYVEIDSSEFESVMETISFDKDLKDKIISRLNNAFKKNSYYRFEEAYILNTLAKDFELSTEQTMVLLNTLRIRSMSNVNCKINHKVDSRLFEYLHSSC